MTGYWIRHRFLLTLILCVAVAAIAGFLFTIPCISQQANNYNSQSIYKNTAIDFIAPEPSYEQVQTLPGNNGIDKVFPYFLTKTQVSVNGANRTTTVLLSDQFENVDITMYTETRLIEKTNENYESAIWVDWQFCHETGAKIGDTVSLSLGGTTVKYRISAIYETNSIYDGGAILAQISDEQAAVIKETSKNNGYSGMYIASSDYGACHAYLATDYRPLGRLKDRDMFDTEEQYQIHYEAIMSSGYANEITDFRVRENDLKKTDSSMMIWIGAVLSAVLMAVFNIAMRKRGCEKGYFTKHCIPKGQNVKPYYSTAFIWEIILFTTMYAVALFVGVYLADQYIHRTAFSITLLVAPAAVAIAEVACLGASYSMIGKITIAVEERRRKQQEQKRQN